MTCFSILFELAKANSAGVSGTGGYAQVRNYSIEMDRKNINVSSLVAVAQDVTPLLRIAMSASVVPSPSVRNYFPSVLSSISGTIDEQKRHHPKNPTYGIGHRISQAS